MIPHHVKLSGGFPNSPPLEGFWAMKMSELTNVQGPAAERMRYADTETTWSWDSHCVSVNNIYRLVFAFNSDKVINIFYQYNMILPDDLYPRVG